MYRLSSAFALVAMLVSTTSFAAGEPAFCDPKTFLSLEKATNSPGTSRLHMYRVGRLWLAGLAVGNSEVAGVQAVAQNFGRIAPNDNSCTWYFNDGNRDAQKAFSYRYVGRPGRNIDASVAEYDSTLNSIFDRDQVNMVSCAQRYGYIAMGCDGMKHRGPTVFAMTLAFAGCSATNAVTIANSVWGTNGIPTPTRIAIAQRAYDIGTARPASRKALQDLMTAR